MYIKEKERDVFLENLKIHTLKNGNNIDITENSENKSNNPTLGNKFNEKEKSTRGSPEKENTRWSEKSSYFL